MQIEELTKIYQERIKPFFARAKTQTTQRCCITTTNNELSLLHIDFIQGIPEILATETLHYKDPSSLSLLLKSLNNKFNLNTIPIYWLLQPDDYQFFLLESLPVPDNEIKSALQWRIRSLINYPITDAVIDYFKIPEKKVSPQKPMISVISARKTKIQPIIDLAKSANLELAVIDIPELALRNLTALLENDEKSTAMLYFSHQSVILNITQQKKLYFSRKFIFNNLQNPTPQDFENASLEIVRFFDYFQSQWRTPAPTRILYIADHNQYDQTAKILSESLLMPVEKFTLKSSFLTDQLVIKKLNEQYLMLIGCALREINGHEYAKH